MGCVFLLLLLLLLLLLSLSLSIPFHLTHHLPSSPFPPCHHFRLQALLDGLMIAEALDRQFSARRPPSVRLLSRTEDTSDSVSDAVRIAAAFAEYENEMVARTTSKVFDSRSTVSVLHTPKMTDPHFHPERKVLNACECDPTCMHSPVLVRNARSQYRSQCSLTLSNNRRRSHLRSPACLS
jgi:hypothetical protein